MHYGKKKSWRRQPDALSNVLLGDLGVNVDVILTRTTFQNTVEDEVHTFMATVFLIASCSKIMRPVTLQKKVQEWCKGHDKEFSVFSNTSDQAFTASAGQTKVAIYMPNKICW